MTLNDMTLSDMTLRDITEYLQLRVAEGSKPVPASLKREAARHEHLVNSGQRHRQGASSHQTTILGVD